MDRLNAIALEGICIFTGQMNLSTYAIMLLLSTDPDNVEPFPVHCEMMEYPPIGISVVGHDQENEVSYYANSPLKC